MPQLKIGDIVIKSNVLLAPMAGITDYPFRKIVSNFDKNILTFSEMISSEALIRKNKKTIHMLSSDHEIRAVQIFGNDPIAMAESAKYNEENGANIIDINMGCPAKKIVNTFAGSCLMKTPELALKIIESVVNSVNIPVTLKMRLGWDESSKNASEIAKIAEKIGIKMITIHGRTRCQMYNGSADWDEIKKTKDSVKNIPVICNGDITSINSAREALKKSTGDGVMIGRAAIGRPWLLHQISFDLDGMEIPESPNAEEIFKIIKEHLSLSIDFYGEELGVKNFRKHLLAYTRGFKDSAKFRNEILSELNPEIVIKKLENFFCVNYPSNCS